MKRNHISLLDGRTIQPFRVYRLRGGYRLIVERNRNVWQDYDGCYTLVATARDWKSETICRQSACRAANFSGFNSDVRPA